MQEAWSSNSVSHHGGDFKGSDRAIFKNTADGKKIETTERIKLLENYDYNRGDTLPFLGHPDPDHDKEGADPFDVADLIVSADTAGSDQADPGFLGLLPSFDFNNP
jgi:hypothetical protein